MKTRYLLSLAMLMAHLTAAQSAKDTIPGEYHLRNVRETASAILLKPDSTFEIYFSYGAMDRQGTGKWEFADGKVILNSRSRPSLDYALITSKKIPEPFTIVRIVDVNKQLMPFFEVLVKTNGEEKYGKMNQEGIFQTEKVKTDSINLFFGFTPERYSSFPTPGDNNYFEFRIEPWLAEIFVENIVLKLSDEGLTGGHPLLNGSEFVFERMR